MEILCIIFAADDIVGKNYSSGEEDDGDDADKESSDSEAEPPSKQRKLSTPPVETSPPMTASEVINETQEQYKEILRKKKNPQNKKYSICFSKFGGFFKDSIFIT